MYDDIKTIVGVMTNVLVLKLCLNDIPHALGVVKTISTAQDTEAGVLSRYRTIVDRLEPLLGVNVSLEVSRGEYPLAEVHKNDEEDFYRVEIVYAGDFDESLVSLFHELGHVQDEEQTKAGVVSKPVESGSEDDEYTSTMLCEIRATINGYMLAKSLGMEKTYMSSGGYKGLLSTYNDTAYPPNVPIEEYDANSRTAINELKEFCARENIQYPKDYYKEQGDE